MIKFITLSICLNLLASLSVASDDHSGHSDDLLFLLQHKIAISKLQKKHLALPPSEQNSNRQQQTRHFNKALPKLTRYMAVPESRYPNLDMYAQSLKSRSALLNDYAQLLLQFYAPP